MHEEIYRFNQSGQRQALQFGLAGVSYCDGTYQITRPKSEIACIEYIIAGSGTVEINKQVFHPQAGDTYFLHAGTNQRYYSSADDPWTKVWINLSGTLLDDLIMAYGLHGRYFYSKMDVRREIEAVVGFAEKKDENMILKSTLKVHEIVYKLSQMQQDSVMVDSVASELQRYMDARIEGRLQLAELAAKAGKSESQVIRIFREQYGMTPYAYFLKAKIDLAKKLLRGSQMSVRQVALQLDFADEFYFSNVFKRQVGVSPSQYRKQ